MIVWQWRVYVNKVLLFQLKILAICLHGKRIIRSGLLRATTNLISCVTCAKVALLYSSPSLDILSLLARLSSAPCAEDWISIIIYVEFPKSLNSTRSSAAEEFTWGAAVAHLHAFTLRRCKCSILLFTWDSFLRDRFMKRFELPLCSHLVRFGPVHSDFGVYMENF